MSEDHKPEVIFTEVPPEGYMNFDQALNYICEQPGADLFAKMQYILGLVGSAMQAEFYGQPDTQLTRDRMIARRAEFERKVHAHGVLLHSLTKN